MDYYEEFGVLRSATPDQIRQAYRNMARLLHPDQFQDPELNRLAEGQMKRINEIFAVLSDPRRRWEYDEPPRPPPPPVSARYREQAGWAAALLVAGAWICWTFIDPPVPPARPAPTAAAAPAPPPYTPPAPRAAVSRPRAIQSSRTVEPKREELHPEPSQPSVEPPPPVMPVAVASTPAPATPALPPPPKPKGFDGRWFYLRPSLPPASKELYPPDYIEAVIFEKDGKLRGRYQARYKVTDRPISPEVSFQFEGVAAGNPAMLPWTGGGGARGEVQLRQLSRDSLEVKWFATDLGKQFGLASGTAVLIRRHEP